MKDESSVTFENVSAYFADGPWTGQRRDIAFPVGDDRHIRSDTLEGTYKPDAESPKDPDGRTVFRWHGDVKARAFGLCDWRGCQTGLAHPRDNVFSRSESVELSQHLKPPSRVEGGVVKLCDEHRAEALRMGF